MAQDKPKAKREKTILKIGVSKTLMRDLAWHWTTQRSGSGTFDGWLEQIFLRAAREIISADAENHSSVVGTAVSTNHRTAASPANPGAVAEKRQMPRNEPAPRREATSQPPRPQASAGSAL